MLLDTEQLRTLVAFADAGSCKGAAQLVHKTPDRVIRSLLSLLLAYAGVKLLAI